MNKRVILILFLRRRDCKYKANSSGFRAQNIHGVNLNIVVESGAWYRTYEGVMYRVDAALTVPIDGVFLEFDIDPKDRERKDEIWMIR